MDKKLSIIVPVYNAEKYIKNLTDCLRNTSDKRVEFIFVNDGSKDNSLEILNNEACGDARFRVLTKENGGVSSARNTGLKEATGEYIWFIDSDDLPSDGAVETLLSEFERQNCDMYIFDYVLIKKNGTANCRAVKFETEADYEHDTVCENANRVVINKVFSREISNSVWNVVFKNEIIKKNGILFNETVTNGEDGMFFFEYADKISTAKYITKPLYRYNQTNENSATMNVKPSMPVSHREVYKVRKKYLEKYGFDDKNYYKNRLVYATFKAFVGIKWNKNVSDKALKECISVTVNDEFFSEVYRSVNANELPGYLKAYRKMFLKKQTVKIYLMVSLFANAYKILKKQ